MGEKGDPQITGPQRLTYRSIEIGVDEATLGRLRSTRSVFLRAVCSERIGSLDLILENGIGKQKGTELVTMDTDYETMVGMMSPTMEVVFSCKSMTVSCRTKEITQNPIFSGLTPLEEPKRN